MDERKPLLGALTGIRTPFAILVVVNHVAIVFHAVSLNPGNEGPEWQAWCSEGNAIFTSSWITRGLIQGACVGLSLFFTLSGFILTYIYDPGSENRSLDNRDFFIARFARVYPLYVFALIVTIPIFLVVTVSKGFSVPTIIAMGLSTIFLLQSWWPQASTVWNAPGWSLSTEAFFYVMFPMLIRFFHGWSRTGLLAMVPVLWLVSMIAPAWYHATNPDGLDAINWASEGVWFHFVKHNPLIRLPEFIFGVVLGKLFLIDREKQTEDRGLQGAILSTSALIAVIAVLSKAESIPYLFLHNGLTSPLFFVMLYGLALGGGPLASTLSRPFMILLGDSTYAMYLLHTPIIAYTIVVIIDKLKKGETPMSPMAFFYFCLIVSTVISIWSYRKFEIPWRRRIRKYFALRPPA